MSISPSRLIVVGVVCTCWLQSLEICEVECLLGIGDELAFFEVLHDVECMTMDCRCDQAYHVKNQPYIGLSMAMEL
jgi:hypothetical protein